MLNLTIRESRSIVKGKNIGGYKNLFKKWLEDLINKPQRSKLTVSVPWSKVSKPIPLPRLKKPISLQRLVPLPRSQKPISLTRIENDLIEYNIIKDPKNLFKLKKENKPVKEKIIRDIRNFLNQ